MTLISMPASVTAYAEKYTTPESQVLADLNRETNMKVGSAVMLSGHLQGALLQMISHAIRPDLILEIGTFTGYSAICLAQGLQKGGRLHTIDIEEEYDYFTTKYFSDAGLNDIIVPHIGRADEIIPTLTDVFDLVFIDADKVNYGDYYDLVFDKVRPGGFILADNVLYEGEVILPEEERSKNARAMHLFNEKIQNDPRVEQMILPIRDGIMMIRKR